MTHQGPICIIACGDREGVYEEWRQTIRNVLLADDIKGRYGVILHGDSQPVKKGAMGIDKCVGKVAGMHGWQVIPIPAMWERYGKRAGPMRNNAMLTIGKAMQQQGYELRCYAFHDDFDNSRGTWHMVGIAEADGVPATVFTKNGETR
jgi:hypothetical protein